MTSNPIREDKYYAGQVGYLYPYDIRHDADDKAFCNPRPDGQIRFRLHTEHGFDEANLVYNDGRAHGAPMQIYARDSRFLYWEASVLPAHLNLTYSFALKTDDGRIVYYCRHGVDHAVEPLDRWTLNLDGVTFIEPPDWIRSAVFYQIFPERFANGDRTNDPPSTVPWGSPPTWYEFQGGDLPGVVEHLGYLYDLGIDVLYFNPVNESPSVHKFDATDFYHVDPAFGGDEALRALVQAAHARGMCVIVDASFNHCHPRFFAFQDVIANGPASPYWDWFTIYSYPIKVRYRPAAHEATYLRWLEEFSASTGIQLEEADGEGPSPEPSYLAWYGVLEMPKLNQRNPATRAYFLDVAVHWLRFFDIDGWRMDVARQIEPDFWIDFRQVCKLAKPDCYLLSEIWGNTSPWLQGDQFDGTMNYIFRDLCVGYFARAEMDTMTFLDGITRMLSLYAPQVVDACQNLLSSHDVARFRTVAGDNIRRLRLATLFQMTVPGAPSIYYGDEIGMAGGNDPDCRRAFPWHEPESWDREMLQATRELIQLRRAYPALRSGTWRAIWNDEEAFAFERRLGEERVLVLINRGPARARLDLPIDAGQPTALWGSGRIQASGGRLIVEQLPACDGLIIQCTL